MTTLQIAGELKDIDMADLVRSLWRSAETGVLSVQDGERSRSLHLVKGQVVFATSEDPDDRLGVMLLRDGRIARRAAVALGAKVAQGRRFGSLLVEHRMLSPDELQTAVRRQLGRILARVIAQRRGRYTFNFGEPALDESILLERDSGALLLQAVRTLDDWSRIERGLGPEGGAWLVAPASARALDLSEDEVQLVALLAQPKTFDQLAGRTGLNDFQLGRALWGLSLAAVVVRAEAADEDSRPEPAAGTAVATHVIEVIPPGQTTPSEPRTVMSPELDGALSLFNEKHSYLYRVLKVEVGAGVEVFIRSCIRRAGARVGEVFEGSKLDATGRFDLAPIKSNIVAKRTADYPERLKALLDAETQALMRMTGHDRGAMIVDGLGVVEQRGRATPTPAPAQVGAPGSRRA